MFNGNKPLATIITGIIAFLGWAGAMVWWAANQQAAITANRDAIVRIEENLRTMNTPLSSKVSVLSERVDLLNGQVATNRELAQKIILQQEVVSKSLDEIKLKIMR
jgi:hypothetical protein